MGSTSDSLLAYKLTKDTVTLLKVEPRYLHNALNEEVGFKIPTTRSRNNSVFCGALL